MSEIIIDNLNKIYERYVELGKELSSREVLSNSTLLTKIAKERSSLEPKVRTYNTFQELKKQLEEANALVSEEHDPEMLELARSEIESLNEKLAALNEELKIMLLPSDTMDGKDIIMEIRAGTGGDEAALFSGSLYRMYSHFADIKGYKVETLTSTSSGMGGFKEIIFSISGSDVYSLFKYESGVHRVQRVPVTESSGRIHTSAASVVVLPETDDVTIEINPNDLKIDVYRSSGPGGQSVNTTDSAVRIKHIPTGIMVTCQDEKSQHKNKAKAFKVLRARLLDKAIAEQLNARTAKRRSMINTGDRSVKIRTYNYPQNRVTDHRINLTLYKLDAILEGNLDDLIEPLQIEDRKRVLEDMEKEWQTKTVG